MHGWLVLDKPQGLTSSQAVAAVRRLFDAAKAGHGGTLDPLATGVLPVALGEATKTVPWVMGGLKRYRFTLRWGEARDSDDALGELTGTSAVRPACAAIEQALPLFLGLVWQRPPAYSAVKLDGIRAYDRARAGEPVVLAPRQVRIYGLCLVAIADIDHAEFEASVGKGTYIRSLARDLGEALGTLAHVTALRRLAVGPFRAEAAISLDKLATLGHSAAAFGHLLPIETALDDIPALALSEAEAQRLRCGQAVRPLDSFGQSRLEKLADGTAVFSTAVGKPVAVTEIAAGELRPLRVLNF